MTKSWSNWPYWLRGGIISLSILSILFLIALPVMGTCKLGVQCNRSWYQILANSILIPILNPVESLGDMLAGNDIGIFIMFLLYFFAIGALLGFIYGKLKSRRKPNL